MNVNSTNSSNNFSPCTVVSKYFASSPVMDESLSEFKEKKSGCKGPKNSEKLTVNKAKPKKLPKRIRGQKDIRTALKTKNNEQIKYAQEFNEICKQAGVDVDSEQLQLAIALSNSLKCQEDESNTSNKPLSAQERSKKIRTTLQEYGFCVPEIKITNKRVKNRKKKYKLLLSTDTEKHQIISDRYAQVLLSNSSSFKTEVSSDIDYSTKKCYYVASGITYTALKSNSILYVEDLLEKSTSKGGLLRDWASIPGRPLSPVKSETVNMNISEIECSQEEFDIILSGTLKSAKDVVKKKVKSSLNTTPTIVIDLDDNTKPMLPVTIEDKNDKTLVNTSAHIESIEVTKNKTFCVSDRVRSFSPDIFDDEVSLVLYSDNNTSKSKSEIEKIQVNAIMDLTEHDNKQLICEDNETNEGRDDIFMDLTQAESNEINHKSDATKQNVTTKIFKPLSQCSPGSNFTRRKSDDFMEITECIGVSSLRTNHKTNDGEISGHQKTRRHSDELIEVAECVAISCSQLNVKKHHLQTTMSQTINITKRKSNDPMEMTECVATASSCIPLNVEDNIDLTQNCDQVTYAVVGEIVNNIVENIDLSQSSNSVDELPFVQVSGTNNSLDDTILLKDDEILGENSPKSFVMSKSCTVTLEHTLNLTDTPPSPVKTSGNNSFFDEFVHNHSDDTTKETESTQRENNKIVCKEISNNDEFEVDLTQSSNSSVASTENNSNHCGIQSSKDMLGKKDDVSIDYDEMYDIITSNTNDSTRNVDNVSSVVHDITDENDPKPSESDNISMNSQVFDISDKELEYSLNQSRHDAVWEVGYGGISVIDRDFSIRKSDVIDEKTENAPDITNIRSVSDSLPMVKVKSNEDKFKTPVAFNEKAVTPFKAFTNDNAVTVDTPTSNEYIVKTDQVTPILDYASMSTPERNKELDKYGLKPFKRKRAIQLLTHLYNQTHPIVDSCQNNLPSPSKKRKPSQPSPKKCSPRKKSPGKLLKSPAKVSRPIESIDENSENVYEVTNELPILKEVECTEEDWVFQKREKAKVHSCRVPLHIALHNFVSCRQRLREAILRYDPVNIDVIHKELAASGHRYDPKDLLKFLDKKCITVKTADNNARNNKR